jgi:hypothetical protein
MKTLVHMHAHLCFKILNFTIFSMRRNEIPLRNKILYN